MSDAAWYFVKQGVVQGPLGFKALRELAAAGGLDERDPVRRGTVGPWLSAGTVNGLIPKQPAAPPPLPAPSVAPVSSTTAVSQTTASKTGVSKTVAGKNVSVDPLADELTLAPLTLPDSKSAPATLQPLHASDELELLPLPEYEHRPVRAAAAEPPKHSELLPPEPELYGVATPPPTPKPPPPAPDGFVGDAGLALGSAPLAMPGLPGLPNLPAGVRPLMRKPPAAKDPTPAYLAVGGLALACAILGGLLIIFLTTSSSTPPTVVKKPVKQVELEPERLEVARPTRRPRIVPVPLPQPIQPETAPTYPQPEDPPPTAMPNPIPSGTPESTSLSSPESTAEATAAAPPAATATSRTTAKTDHIPQATRFVPAAGQKVSAPAASVKVTPVGQLSGSDLEFRALAFSEDGTRFATAGVARVGQFALRTHLLVLNPADGTLIKVLPNAHDTRVDTIALTPDGAMLVSGAHDGEIRLWTVETAERSFQAAISNRANDWINAVIFRPQRELRIMVGSGRYPAELPPDAVPGSPAAALGKITEFDINNNGPSGTLESTSPVTALGVLPDNKTLLFASPTGSVGAWNFDFYGQTETIPAFSEKLERAVLAISPLGDQFAVSGLGAGSIKVWNIAKKKWDRTFKVEEPGVQALSFSSDGKWLASSAPNSQVHVWDIAGGSLLATLEGHRGTLQAVAFSPTEPLLITASAEGANAGQIFAWRLETVAAASPTSPAATDAPAAASGKPAATTPTSTKPAPSEAGANPFSEVD